MVIRPVCSIVGRVCGGGNRLGHRFRSHFRNRGLGLCLRCCWQRFFTKQFFVIVFRAGIRLGLDPFDRTLPCRRGPRGSNRRSTRRLVRDGIGGKAVLMKCHHSRDGKNPTPASHDPLLSRRFILKATTGNRAARSLPQSTVRYQPDVSTGHGLSFLSAAGTVAVKLN